MKKMEEKTKWLIVAVISMLAITFVISAGVASKEIYMQTSNVMSNTELVSSQSKIDDISAADNNKISDQLAAVVEAEPNNTVEVIIVTTFEVVPMMSQSLIDGHHAAVEQLGSDKLKVTVVASEIPAISEYEWVQSIFLTSEVLAGKIGGQLSSVIEAEPNSTVEAIIVTTFEVVPMMSQSLIDGHHAAVEQLESDKLKVTVVASEIPAILEYEWVESITLTSEATKDNAKAPPSNIDEKEAVRLAKQAFIADYGLDPTQGLTILDTGVYHSSYTKKKWQIIKLTNMEVGALYTVALDDGSVSQGWDAVERYEQEQAAIVGKISPLLSSVISRTSPEEINVVIVLRKQPNIREIVKASEGEVREELDAAFSKGEKGKTKKIVSEIRENVTSRSKQFCIAHGQDTVCNYLETVNAKIIYRGKLRNHVIAQVPVSALEELGRLPEVQTIEPDLACTAYLDVSTRAINADDVWPWVEGNTHTSSAGVVNEVSIFDSGIDCSHPALTCSGNWNYVSSYESTTDDLHGHGTHVAGIVASQDSTYRGVAPGVDILNEKVAYKTNGNASSPPSAVIQALEHSYNYISEMVQYSYGWYPPSTGDDYYQETKGNSELSKTFDAYVEAGLTCTISAGNEGSSYDTITVPGDAFNVITVGNFNDHNTYTRTDDDVWWSSSRGYTGDGRTKPDVAAPGSYIMSTNAFWEGGNPDFISYTGTSMAAPHVAGIAALEIDEWARLYSERLSGWGFVYGGPLAIRAMIYNSADETTGDSSGAQNDRISGTGYVDAYQAWAQAEKETVKIISLTGANSAYYSINVNPGDTIKATIAWNRHVDLSTITPKTLSDIDLKLKDLSDTLLASSSDAQTNWEKIAYTYTGASPTTLRICVDPWGSVPAEVGTETIALACSHAILPQDDMGIFRNGQWILRNSKSSGTADYRFNYGNPSDVPVPGDWNGDGEDGIGVYRNGQWILRNDKSAGAADHRFNFGNPTDKPVTGDWNGNGVDTIGVYRNGQWILRNSNSAGGANYRFNFGNPTDKPVTGDWDGDGVDTIGVYRNGQWILRNSNSAGGANYRFNFGNPTDKPVTGDWDGNGEDTIGVYRNGQWILRNSNSAGSADYRFNYGNPTDKPVTGDWDGM